MRVNSSLRELATLGANHGSPVSSPGFTTELETGVPVYRWFKYSWQTQANGSQVRQRISLGELSGSEKPTSCLSLTPGDSCSKRWVRNDSNPFANNDNLQRRTFNEDALLDKIIPNLQKIVPGSKIDCGSSQGCHECVRGDESGPNNDGCSVGCFGYGCLRAGCTYRASDDITGLEQGIGASAIQKVQCDISYDMPLILTKAFSDKPYLTIHRSTWNPLETNASEYSSFYNHQENDVE